MVMDVADETTVIYLMRTFLFTISSVAIVDFYNSAVGTEGKQQHKGNLIALCI